VSTLRFDQTTSDWVVFAPSRQLRPHEFSRRRNSVMPEAAVPTACAFCPGNEAFTPPEIQSVPALTGNSRWRVRVFPNKFPALRIEEQPIRNVDQGFFQSMGGCGAHEVIVESPDHSSCLAQQPVEQIECVLQTLQSRYSDLMGDTRFQTVVLFKNHGVEAGTSLSHPHWQLIATPVVPRLLRLKHFEASEYFDRTGQSLYRDLAVREMDQNQRVIAKNSSFVAFMPFASHCPFETWIVPLQSRASFRHVIQGELQQLAVVLKQVLLKLYTGLENPAFNLTVDDAPRGDEDKEYFVWHIRILPRLSTPAGFELGSGMSINTVMPEDAASFINQVPITI
jgi:UDPglucose--hexose-1-phosphate uridylyltransferase